MERIDTLFIAVALAMDAFAVSIAAGVALKSVIGVNILREHEALKFLFCFSFTVYFY